VDQDRGARAITRERNSVEMPFANFETVSPGQMRLLTRLVREPCANILPAICPTRSGFWAQFAACSGIARQRHVEG
jgi:hypothetical protein